jgi:hypothetical protein
LRTPSPGAVPDVPPALNLAEQLFNDIAGILEFILAIFNAS